MIQKMEILQYLQAGNSLTQLEALMKFGCMRLASRISEIRQMGYEIDVDFIVTRQGKRVAQYSLGKG